MKGRKFRDSEDVICAANVWLEEYIRPTIRLPRNLSFEKHNAGPSAFQLSETMLESDKT